MTRAALDQDGPQTRSAQEGGEADRPSWSTRALGVLSSTDHKVIGLGYIVSAVVFFVFGAIEAMVMRIQLAEPQNSLVSPHLYSELFTMHGTTMVFLMGIPMLLGFANYFVPLMIGADDIAFPRLNALAFWLVPLGGALLYFSFLVPGGAPSAGWFAYAPLSGPTFNPLSGVDYWLMSLLVLGVGSVAGAINLLVTILSLRAPGISLQRLPLFVWMVGVTAVLLILAIPSLNAALVLLVVDRKLGATFFAPNGGGSALLWQHLFWIFGHPEVYILILPAFGMISEVIPVFSRRPIYGYGFVAASTVAIGLLSFGVWAHHMFATGLGAPLDAFFAIASLLIAIPTGIKIFNWTATMWGGRVRYTTSMLFAIAFLFQFTIGGLSGVLFAAVPADWQLTDTYFVVAHLHYVLFGGTIFGVLAAVYYWFPKMTGRMLSERIGRWHFWLTVLGFNLTFFVQHILGLMGMPRRTFTYAAHDRPGWMVLNDVSTAGTVVLGVSVLLMLYNLVRSKRRGEPAGPNPWGAFTAEWMTSSPPPPGNFKTKPVFRSRRPAWDADHPDHADYKVRPTARDNGWRPHPLRSAMVATICSEATFFVLMLASFLVFTMGVTESPARQSLEVVRTGIFSAVLVGSSFTFWMAERALRRRRAVTEEGGPGKAFVIWLGITIAMGLAFLGNEGHEWWGLITHGARIQSGVFTASFFTITGLHAMHVTVGLLLLILIGKSQFRSGQSRLDEKNKPATTFAAVGMYWHFVDAVWIGVYSVIYLKFLHGI